MCRVCAGQRLVTFLKGGAWVEPNPKALGGGGFWVATPQTLLAQFEHYFERSEASNQFNREFGGLTTTTWTHKNQWL